MEFPRCQQKSNGSLPLVSVAICTRDRSRNLRSCLRSIQNLSYPDLEIMVVDNAPGTDATRLVSKQYSNVRYLVEPRPGLDWARNRAIMEARGKIIAFSDDDVVVDPEWIEKLVRVFTEDSQVMAVTGLVVPYELETKAQILFERYGGFEKGFEFRRFQRICQNSKLSRAYLNAGELGTGANMAFRLSLFYEIGGFDPSLDTGTLTCGGGDLEMLFRVIHEGYPLVYEPNAMVRHVHRRTYKALRYQIIGWGTAFVAFLMRSAMAYPEIKCKIWCFLMRWFVGRHLIRLFKHLRGPEQIPLDLMLAELWGSLTGLFAYHKARLVSKKIESDFGPADDIQSRESH
ncbi:MAG: glycosyltransferase [Deltaproteobacteria bacterium]|nr:glycosyltransferase [Deltaproteobacteria bacterium]